MEEAANKEDTGAEGASTKMVWTKPGYKKRSSRLTEGRAGVQPTEVDHATFTTVTDLGPSS